MNDARNDASPLHDLWARLALSPVFGVAIPKVSGLIDHRRHTTTVLVFSYLFFSGVAFVIWEGNRRLHFRLSHREEWLERPWHRAGVLLAVIAVYTIPVSSALLMAWQWVTGDPGLRPFALPTAVLAIVAVVAVITNVYETAFLLRDWESARLRSARAESARLAAELERLTREVDPHFLFNNLHALQQLVETGDSRAGTFLEALGDTYRYVLAARNRPLVSLAEELAALRHHHTLAAIRYGGSVGVEVNVPDAAAGRLLVPPVCLGELLLNALKHNLVDASHPLVLSVTLRDDQLVVSNRISYRARQTASTGVGLANLGERARLATGRSMQWGAEGEHFVVRIPLAASGLLSGTLHPSAAAGRGEPPRGAR